VKYTVSQSTYSEIYSIDIQYDTSVLTCTSLRDTQISTSKLFEWVLSPLNLINRPCKNGNIKLANRKEGVVINESAMTS